MTRPTIMQTTHQAADDMPASVESVLSGGADTLVAVNAAVLDGPRLEGVLGQVAPEYAESLKGLAFTVKALGDPDPVQLAAWLGEHIAHPLVLAFVHRARQPLAAMGSSRPGRRRDLGG